MSGTLTKKKQVVRSKDTQDNASIYSSLNSAGHKGLAREKRLYNTLQKRDFFERAQYIKEPIVQGDPLLPVRKREIYIITEGHRERERERELWNGYKLAFSG